MSLEVGPNAICNEGSLVGRDVWIELYIEALLGDVIVEFIAISSIKEDIFTVRARVVNVLHELLVVIDCDESLESENGSVSTAKVDEARDLRSCTADFNAIVSIIKLIFILPSHCHNVHPHDTFCLNGIIVGDT